MFAMLKVAFRTHGGSKIGMGHLMRCLALANAFPDDILISFITESDEMGLRVIKESGYKVFSFSTNSVQEELNFLKEIIKNNIDILITDSYKIDQEYLKELKNVVKRLVSIHDFTPFPFPSDLVINGNVYAPDLEYESYSGDTKFLLGTRYLLMRDEFIGLSGRIVNKEVKNILITVGGGDHLNLTPRIITSLDRLKESSLNVGNLHIDIVIGPAFNNTSSIIKSLRKTNIEMSLHFNVNKISNLMLKSDLAVSAGGSTLYELAATGTPAVALLQANNQIQAAEVMAEKGMIINLGIGDQVSSETIAKSITELINNYELRKKMSRAGQKLVDGKGAMRCVEEILS